MADPVNYGSQWRIPGGVKTDKGIPDGPHAAKLLNMSAPLTTGALLKNGDGPSLTALAD
jgi:hypothetical protein